MAVQTIEVFRLLLMRVFLFSVIWSNVSLELSPDY